MNFVSSSSKFFHRWLFSTNQKKIGFLYSFAFFVGLFVLFSLFWYIVNDSLILTVAYAVGNGDPSVGTFTITSLEQVSCETVSEFNNSMNSLITDPIQEGNSYKRFIKIKTSVINTDNMSVFQKISLKSMPDQCFRAYGSFSK